MDADPRGRGLKMSVRPIFVLGLQRSGTTWLANLLASHPDIAAVAAADHNGVHESIFFSHFARAFGAWQDAHAREAFTEAFGQSDYWLLTGLPVSELSAIVADAASHAEVFCATMERVAAAQGAAAWVEKSPHHALMSPEIATSVPGARFVMVLRDTREMILSRLSGFGRQPPTGAKRAADLARAAIVNTLFARSFRRLARRGDHLLVRYEDLRSSPAQESRRILEFLELDAPEIPLASAFEANSSFHNSVRTRLSVSDRAVITVASAISSVVPLPLLRWLHGLRGRRRGIVWPDWCWKRSGWRPTGYGRVEVADLAGPEADVGGRPV
jgi:hypothetical protein